MIGVPVEPQKQRPRSSSVNDNWMVESEACVIKDAGDDPDITNGMQIKVNIALPFNMDEVNSGKQQDDYNIIMPAEKG